MSKKKVDKPNILPMIKIHNFDQIKLIFSQDKVLLREILSPNFIKCGQRLWIFFINSFGLVYFFLTCTLLPQFFVHFFPTSCVAIIYGWTLSWVITENALHVLNTKPFLSSLFSTNNSSMTLIRINLQCLDDYTDFFISYGVIEGLL